MFRTPEKIVFFYHVHVFFFFFAIFIMMFTYKLQSKSSVVFLLKIKLVIDFYDLMHCILIAFMCKTLLANCNM